MLLVRLIVYGCMYAIGALKDASTRVFSVVGCASEYRPEMFLSLMTCGIIDDASPPVLLTLV